MFINAGIIGFYISLPLRAGKSAAINLLHRKVTAAKNFIHRRVK